MRIFILIMRKKEQTQEHVKLIDYKHAAKLVLSILEEEEGP